MRDEPHPLFSSHDHGVKGRASEKKREMSMFAAATKKAASARFKQPQLDSEGQEIEVGGGWTWGGEEGESLCCSMMSGKMRTRM